MGVGSRCTDEVAKFPLCPMPILYVFPPSYDTAWEPIPDTSTTILDTILSISIFQINPCSVSIIIICYNNTNFTKARMKDEKTVIKIQSRKGSIIFLEQIPQRHLWGLLLKTIAKHICLSYHTFPSNHSIPTAKICHYRANVLLSVSNFKKNFKNWKFLKSY